MTEYRTADELPFEQMEKHKLGLNTEESAHRILGKQYLTSPRAVPSSSVGECDAILFTRAGLFVVEVKRWFGHIEEFSKDETWRVVDSKSERHLPNPITRLNKRVNALRNLIAEDPAWRNLAHLWRVRHKIAIPIHSVLCFGPTTTYPDDTNSEHIIVCNTRNVAPRTMSVISELPSIPGSSVLAHRIGMLWPQEGRLTLHGKKGYVRCFPNRWENYFASLHGVSRISGGDGVLELTYTADPFEVESENVIFSANVLGKWEMFDVPSRSIKQWTNSA